MKTKKVFIYIIFAIAFLFILWWLAITFMQKQEIETVEGEIRYVAMGDSYTFGQGVSLKQTFPFLLTKHFNERGFPVMLHTVIAQSGWTSQQLIDQGLQGFRISQPDFATLLIGANDWVQYVEKETFRNRLSFLLDEMIASLPSNKSLIVLTIPDFSATPLGSRVGGGRDISAGISEFNDVIVQETEKRDVAVVDIFTLSQGMKNNPSLYVNDGLHPSEIEYQLWEEKIFPQAIATIDKILQ